MKRSDLTHVIFLVCVKHGLKLHRTEELISWVYNYDTCFFFVFCTYDTGSASFFADERKSEVSSVY